MEEINEKIELNNQLISSNKEELETSLANVKKEYADMMVSIENEIAALDVQDKVILDRLDTIDNLLNLLLEKEYFVVQFNSNGGSNIESQLIEKYNKVILPDAPTKNGYDFLGWYVDDEKWSFIGYSVTEDITLNAKWETVQYNISYNLDGGEFNNTPVTTYNVENDIILPIPRKNNYNFVGWYSHADLSGYSIQKISKGEFGNKIFFAKWETIPIPNIEPNINGFDGKGMSYVIKVVNPVSEYDPFDAYYSGTNKVLKQAYLKKIEDSYNIDIVYSTWEDEAPWGPSRVQYIKNSFSNGTFKEKNVYAVQINSSWIPLLVEEDCLLELYDCTLGTGLFNEYNYEQNSINSEISTVNGKVYGYSLGIPRSDSFIYYNQTKVASIGMEDPAELWFKGEWTWSKFDQWVRDAQNRLAYGEYALDFTAADFIINAAPAQGTKMVNANRGTLNFTKSSVTSIIDKMKAYYKDGYWDKAHGVQDVSTNFKQGKTLLHHGSLWFLKDSRRFGTPEDGGILFNIGIVPYPLGDDSFVEVKTTPYEYIDNQGNAVKVAKPILGRNGEPLMTSQAEPIFGIDLSYSNYLSPYYGDSSMFSIINYKKEVDNGIPSSIAFNVLHDLQSAMSDSVTNNEITEDKLYRQYLHSKLDYLLDVEVAMSVQEQSLIYYELMEILSMTAGNGSHFGPNGFWLLISGLMISEDDPAIILAEVEEVYLEALRYLGY